VRYLAAAVGFSALAGSMMPLRPTSLLGPLGQARRYAVTRVPVADLVRIAKGFGVTVNDVVLSAVGGAFRAVLVERGDSVEPDCVRTLVPVNVRKDHERSAPANRISVLLPTLPVEIGDPVGRLRAVHERVSELKRSHEAEAGAGLTTIAPYEPFPVMDAAVRVGLRLPQRALTTVVTNVPGPPAPLYALGRRIREVLPWVPIANRMRVGVSVFTFDGQATFGVTTDFTSVPECGLFAAVIADEVAALGAALRSSAPAAPEPATCAPAPAKIARTRPVAAHAAPTRRPRRTHPKEGSDVQPRGRSA
jgi:diacylglycerol O-acyltransferase